MDQLDKSRQMQFIRRQTRATASEQQVAIGLILHLIDYK